MCAPCHARRYPDAEPETYYQLDKEYRDFVDCVPGENEGEQLAVVAQIARVYLGCTAHHNQCIVLLTSMLTSIFTHSAP